MNGHIVGLRQHLIHGGGALHGAGQCPGVFNGDEGVVADDVHAQMHGGIGHQHADGTQAHDGQRLARDFGTHELRLALFNLLGHIELTGGQRLCPLGTADDVAGGEQETCQGQLFYGVGVGTGGVEHADTGIGALVHGDVVVAGTGSRDGLQGGGQFHVQHGGGADDDGIGCGFVLADGEILVIEMVVDDGRNGVERQNLIHKGKISFL